MGSSIALSRERRAAVAALGDDKHEETQERTCGRGLKFGRKPRAGPGAGGGSVMTTMRKPAAVNASVMACRGRCQEVIGAGRPPQIPLEGPRTGCEVVGTDRGLLLALERMLRPARHSLDRHANYRRCVRRRRHS